MTPQLVRVLRTAASERYLLQKRPDETVGALDLHYLGDGGVSGTVALFENSGVGEDGIAKLLKHIDEMLLPENGSETRTVSFTVVTGRVIGSYELDNPA